MSTSQIKQVGVYGIGHFGYALIRHLSSGCDSTVTIRAFDRDEAVRTMLASEHRHPHYATPTPLDGAVQIVNSVGELVESADAVILAVTSNSTREVIENIAHEIRRDDAIFVNTAKALDFKTGQRLSEIVRHELGEATPYAALAGGTIASELIEQNLLGMTIACEERARLSALRRLFSSERMWVQATTDLVGVEYAGAFKNVIAICAGVARGLGQADGGVTHLISRLAYEVEAFCVRKLGAQRETFSLGSQCWGSDLWMSCIGSTRNRQLGELLGGGMSLDQANAEMKRQRKTVEGVQTLRAMSAIFDHYPGELPLLRAARAVILDTAPASSLMHALMREDEDVC